MTIGGVLGSEKMEWGKIHSRGGLIFEVVTKSPLPQKKAPAQARAMKMENFPTIRPEGPCATRLPSGAEPG